jgi:hypothetical protein
MMPTSWLLMPMHPSSNQNRSVLISQLIAKSTHGQSYQNPGKGRAGADENLSSRNAQDHPISSSYFLMKKSSNSCLQLAFTLHTQILMQWPAPPASCCCIGARRHACRSCLATAARPMERVARYGVTVATRSSAPPRHTPSLPAPAYVTTIAAQLLDWLAPTSGPQLLSATCLLRTPILGMARPP